MGLLPHTHPPGDPLSLLDIPPHPPALVLRAKAAIAPPTRASPMPPSHLLARWATAILVVGVFLAILTTRDSVWWGLHFSQLGTFGDTSSRFFNGATLAAGILLSAYGTVIGADLPATMTRRRKLWIQRSLISAGAYLSLVGLVPIPLCPPLHDMIALGLVLSFVSLIASSVRCAGLTREFQRFALIGLIILIAGMILLFSHVITLAAYELAAFGTMGVWLLRLPLALPVRTHEPAESAEPATTPSVRAPRTPSHQVPRASAVLSGPATAPRRVHHVRPVSSPRPPRRTVRAHQAARGSIRGGPRASRSRGVTARR